MKIITNTKLITRNKKISQFTTYASLAFLGIGVYFTLQNDTASMLYSLISLFLGIIVWQISIYFTNRWGAKVNPYELISGALKGLDDKYTLYHFSTPVSHLLTTPSGIWILIPILTGGHISYDKGKWKQKGGNAILKFFSRDSLGRPEVEAHLEQNNLERSFKNNDIQIGTEYIHSLAVFLNPKAELDVADTPILCLLSGKVKDYLRKLPKSTVIPGEQMQKMSRIITMKEIYR